MKQLKLDLCVIPKSKLGITDYQKRKWRKAFKAYSEKMSQSEKASASGYCCCGYMFYCDCCYGEKTEFDCGKAIEQYCKNNKVKIDYKNYNFEKEIDRIWQSLQNTRD